MKCVAQFFLYCMAFFFFCTINCHAQKTEPQKNDLRVIVFLDTECPISQSYMSELKKLSQAYQDKGVQFEAFFPVYTASDKEIQRFLKKYNVDFRGFTDKDHLKTRRYKASVMPEVVLLDNNGLVAYQGAIDNWYIALGKNRPKPTEFYLRNAIEATLNGNPVITSRTQAVGCLIND